VSNVRATPEFQWPAWVALTIALEAAPQNPPSWIWYWFCKRGMQRTMVHTRILWQVSDFKIEVSDCILILSWLLSNSFFNNFSSFIILYVNRSQGIPSSSNLPILFFNLLQFLGCSQSGNLSDLRFFFVYLILELCVCIFWHWFKFNLVIGATWISGSSKWNNILSDCLFTDS